MAQFEIQFGRLGNHNLMKPDPTRKQLIAEKAEESTTKAAVNKREKKPLTEQQLAAKDAWLATQVARLNSKFDARQQLDQARVKEAAKERSYDNIFYDRLGKIERNAEKGTYTHNPYDYLATGRVSKAGELKMEAARNFSAPANLSTPGNEQDLGGGTARALEQTMNRLFRAMAPKVWCKRCAARPSSRPTTSRNRRRATVRYRVGRD